MEGAERSHSAALVGPGLRVLAFFLQQLPKLPRLNQVTHFSHLADEAVAYENLGNGAQARQELESLPAAGDAADVHFAVGNAGAVEKVLYRAAVEAVGHGVNGHRGQWASPGTAAAAAAHPAAGLVSILIGSHHTRSGPTAHNPGGA